MVLRGRWLFGLIAAAATVVAARADDDPVQTQRPQNQSAAVNARQAIGADEIDGPTILEGLTALNGLDAMRDTLRDRYGFYLHGGYIGDPYADVAGGLRPGATYSGRLDVQLDVDTSKTIGLPGGVLHANMFQIHGSDVSLLKVGTFLSVNDISAVPATRLYELWYEQRFGDKLSIRAGQQGIDVEFLTSSYGANFINASFGWPGLPSADLPDGGPAYPLATPAVRLKYDPTRNLSILAAVFDGVPAGPCADEPQTCDRAGLNFRVSDPPLAFLEGQLRYNQGDSASGLPGRLKLGAFGYFGRLADQRGGVGPSGSGEPFLTPSPNGGVYGIIDQQIYRLPGDDHDDDHAAGGEDHDDEKGVGVFARVIAAPSDRNPIDLYFDAGLSALGLVPGRPNDLFGLAAIFAKTSAAAFAVDRNDLAEAGPSPTQPYAAVIEATYQAEIVPGLAVQPTFQYIVHPGVVAAAPYGSVLQASRNAEVIGVTTTVKF